MGENRIRVIAIREPHCVRYAYRLKEQGHGSQRVDRTVISHCTHRTSEDRSTAYQALRSLRKLTSAIGRGCFYLSIV